MLIFQEPVVQIDMRLMICIRELFFCMRLDVFNHVYPQEYIQNLKPVPDVVTNMSASLRSLRDIDYRISVIDQLKIQVEVLSLAMPTIDDLHIEENVERRLPLPPMMV
ncbi:MAG: hypothetical protein ACP5OC_06210 [Thermoplasmata archaeon]